MEFSNNTTGIEATTASNGTTSSQAAPHNKNTAQRNRSDSPYQGRTAQKDNPNRSGLWGVLWLLIASTGNTVPSKTAAAVVLRATQSGNSRFQRRYCADPLRVNFGRIPAGVVDS